MSKAIFKYNNGNLAILCSQCSTIIKTGFDFTEKEQSACRGECKLEAQFCDDCKKSRKLVAKLPKNEQK